MFEHYKDDKTRKAPKWAVPLFIACNGIVGSFLLGGWIYSLWEVKLLEVPKNSVDLAAAPPPPPPPPPPPGGRKPQTTEIKPKKIKVKDLVQPVKIEKQPETPQTNDSGGGDPNGEEGGVEGGVAGGVVGGDINGVLGAPPPPPPPPPPPAPPQNVAPTALEQQRTSGEKNIAPDDLTKTEIQRSGKSKLVGSFKLCIDGAGNVKSVNMLKSTGFPSYDNRIMSEIRSSWRYRPFMVNGTAAPVCTAVTFIYSQS